MSQQQQEASPHLEDAYTVPTTAQADGEPAASTQEQVIKVYNPASATATPNTEDLPADFFEPTLSDVRAIHGTNAARNKRLNEAPLLTSKYREAEKGERERMKREKWPETTIRVKFGDGTVVQGVIQPVYDFVRSTLSPSAVAEPFILYQPPRTLFPEHPPPEQKPTKKPINPLMKNSIVTPAGYGSVRGGPVQGLQGGKGGKETLAELGLVPQSLLVVRWDDGDMNASSYPAPLKDELKQKSEPLPPAAPKQPDAPAPTASSGGTKTETPTGEKKIPKWLQKGLLKKKT
ncbi:hypothetical protein B9479_003174 [Cryptococcus floricola]|uniref:UBX domain-containing protein n=1 Tax=Cryptococcus floricola TaxID=2591691 RepID=A0A5D3B007_9TREE|nr:hypothetical protein B9479_003174 [Cryptococcus floricola]